VLGLTAVIAKNAPKTDEDVAHSLMTLFGWAGALWRTVFVATLVLTLIILIDVLVQRRWRLARDLLVAALALVGTGAILGRVVASDWSPVELHVLSRWGYPELRVAAATAAIVVVAPELVRPVRVLATSLVPLAALSAVVSGAALPSAAVGALALGLSVGAVTRLVFGTAAGMPSTARVREALAAVGIASSELRPATRQRVGYAEYVGRDADGRPLKARVLGRDAEQTQRLARRWRLLAYRDPSRSTPVGRLEQVEHEALATLMASQAGVRVPGVATAVLSAGGDAFVVTRQPDVEPLENADQVSDELLEDLWQQVETLHAAGISHGRLNASNILVVDGRPMLVDLSAATLGAPQSALDIDVAELLVACTVLVGPERALDTAVDGGRSETVARVLPYLQRAALTPHLRDLARSHEVGLKALRAAAATATGQQVPELAPLRRMRLRDFVVTAAVVFAAYLLISQLAQIGFGTIAHELRQADVAWIVVGVILAQLTFVSAAISFRGAVATPLALLPCVALESAIKFINLTVPSSAGRIGINIRFLQRMGTQTGEAVAGGAVDDLSDTIVEIALVLLTLPFVDLAINKGDLKLSAPSGRLITSVVLVLVAIVAVVLSVPAIRTKLLPSLRGALTGFRTVVGDRKKRLELFGGSIGSECLFALTLGAACLAYGVDLTFAQLLLVNTAASAFAGLIPTPGGVGAAEATLTAGLVAMGVDNSTAFAIAFTHRICTYYLPPIWGYLSLQWLRRRGYV
jgi:glycosyltransferase 2 family protein